MRKTISATLRGLLFLLAAGMFLFSCEENKDEPKRSSEASMTSLTLTIAGTDYDVTFTGKEGKITVPYATELPATATVKAVVLSAKAKGVKVGDSVTLPVSGTVTLTVTAEDDKTKGVYTLTVEKASASKEASITSLTLTVGDSDYKIDFTDRAYTLVLPAGSTLPTAVGVKEITLSAGATSDAGNELTVTDNAVTITVTAEDGETESKYTVTFSVAANEGASITTLTLTAGSTDYEVTFEGTQGSVTVPYGTALPTAVDVKEITLSDGATSDAGTGTALTVTGNAVTITVTAEDGTTESDYTVTFSVAANSEASITSLTLTVGDTDYDIMFEDRQDTITLPYGTAIPTEVEVKEIVLSAGAASDAGTELTVSDNAVTITVTAEDGETKQDYTVTLVVSQVAAPLFTSFTFEVTDNENMALDTADRKRIEGTINQQDNTITFPDQSAYVYLNRLKAAFTTSAGAAVQVGGADQVSGVTEQDFTSSVSYVVRFQDGTETTYTVTLTKSTLATIPDVQFRAKLKEFVPTAFTEDQLNITHNDLVNYNGLLDVKDQTPKLTSVKGIEFFTSLTELYCEKNSLTFLDMSKNTSLTTLTCYANSLTSLDVRANTVLTYLDCGTNSISSLDVSANTSLLNLNCSANSIPSLDVSANTALTTLYCDNNALESLDVRANTALTDLGCNSNKLTSLDVSKNTSLTNLDCSFNALPDLDVRKNTSLKTLFCNSNALDSLDLSTKTALTRLVCNSNKITSLDVSANTALTYLYCNSNKITSLDVSKNTSLTRFNCEANSLTFLDVTGMRSAIVLFIGLGTGTDNPLLTTLRVNTALQDNAAIVSMKTNRGADLTVTTVNNEGTEVCADYTPAQGGGTCN